MLKKLIIIMTTLFMCGFAITAWSLTSHKDYSSMEIAKCHICHEENGVASNHGPMWDREHRLYADKKPNNCQDCHQQSFCLDCHNGGGIDADLHSSQSGPDYMPKSHRSDFREIHPITAREDPKACYRCHDAKRFCLECHNRFKPNDLEMASHRRQFSDINLKSVGPNHTIFNTEQCQTCHPNGLVPTHRWSADHAKEARRNLSTCQTCHPEGDVCMKCHSAATGLKVNPHPRSWGSIKGNLRRASDSRTCIKCHITVP